MSHGHVKTKTVNQYIVLQITDLHDQIQLAGYIILVNLRCRMVM